MSSTFVRLHRHIALLAAALLPLSLASVCRADDKAVKHVAFDARNNTFSAELPHGATFILDVRAPKDMTALTVRFWEATKNCEQPSVAQSAEGVGQDPPKDADYRDFSVQLPRLEPNSAYCLTVHASRPWTADDRTDVSATVASALKAYVTLRSLDAAKLQNILGAGLGKRASYLVKGRNQTLGDVLAAEVSDTKKPIGAAYNKLRDVRLEAATFATEARDAVADLPLPADFDLAKVTPASLKNVLAQRAQLAAKLKSDKTADDLKKLGDQEPQMPPASVEDAGEKAKELAKKSSNAYQAECTKPAKPTACALIDQTNAISGKAADAIDGLQNAPAKYLDAKRALDDAVAVHVKQLEIDVSPLEWKSARPTYTEAAIWYVSADIGGVVPFYGGRADFSLFVGISMNLQAVDKDIPLHGLELGKRLSIVVGLTLAETKDPAGTARGVLDGKGVLTGVGLRATDYLRLGGGAMFVRQREANPLSTETSVRAVPYVGASIDIDVWGTLKTTLVKAP